MPVFQLLILASFLPAISVHFLTGLNTVLSNSLYGSASSKFTLQGYGVGYESKTIRVPSDAPSIQAAVDSADEEDTILISPGHYNENINVFYKSKIVISAEDVTKKPVIDGDGNDCFRILLAYNGEMKIYGLEIFNCYYGIAVSGDLDSNFQVESCKIYQNKIGISFSKKSKYEIINSLIFQNEIGWDHVYYGADSYIVNSTFADNDSDINFDPGWVKGITLFCLNSIFTGNISVNEDNQIVLKYCNYNSSSFGANVFIGEGCHTANPLFVDPINSDYHLISGSACVNSGNNDLYELPAMDFNGDFRIMDGIVDMGAFELPGAIARVNAQISVITGHFDTDGAWEFAIAEILADSTMLLTFYDNDGLVLGQASTGAVREISLARGQFDADAQDEAVLACVMADGTLAAYIFNPDGSLVSKGIGGVCSNVTIATGQLDTDGYDEYVVTLLQSDGTLGAISFNHDGTRVGKGIGGICSNLSVSTGNFDSNVADDEYVVSLLQSDCTLAAITFQGNGTRIGKGVGGLCTNVSVAAGNFRSDNDPQEEYVVSLLQSDGTLAAISFYGNGTRIGKGVGGVCTNVNIASGWYQATSPLDGYVVSLSQADNTPAAIFYTGTGTRIGKGTAPDAVLVTDIDCGDIDGDGYDEAVLGYIAERDLMTYWMVFKESGLEVMSGP